MICVEYRKAVFWLTGLFRKNKYFILSDGVAIATSIEKTLLNMVFLCPFVFYEKLYCIHFPTFALCYFLAAIETYDMDTDSWTTGEKYPQDIWEHTCVTLYIPRCRDDMEVMSTAT